MDRWIKAQPIMHLSTLRKLSVDIAPKVPVLIFLFWLCMLNFILVKGGAVQTGKKNYNKYFFLIYKYPFNYVDEFHGTRPAHSLPENERKLYFVKGKSLFLRILGFEL